VSSACLLFQDFIVIPISFLFCLLFSLLPPFPLLSFLSLLCLGNQIVQCGNEKIRFYSIYGRNISYQDALLTHRAKIQPFLSLGWIGANIVVGTADGSLYRFLGFNLEGKFRRGFIASFCDLLPCYALSYPLPPFSGALSLLSCFFLSVFVSF
jgi:hypothetical protein